MPRSETPGKVQTVLGLVLQSELGPTTTHEHLHSDFSSTLRPAQDAPSAALAEAPVAMEHLGWIRRHYYSNRSNLQLLDANTTISELKLFKAVGGGAIVDATTTSIGRNPTVLSRISRESGVHIVMGAGFYVDALHPPGMDRRTVDELAIEITTDVTNGVNGTGIRSGIIGEIGCSWPLTPNERKALMAAAIAQQETGAAISIHPGRNPNAPSEILEILADSGADVSRVIMGHLDRTVFEFETLERIAGSSCYLEWDLFGNEGSYYPQADLDMPSDAQRLDYIRRIIDAGYRDRVVVGQDIFTKHRLIRYGGHGYGHIFENIVPTMRRKGFSEDEIRAITVINPADVLALV